MRAKLRSLKAELQRQPGKAHVQRGQEVSRALGMTVAFVYLAKSRVMARLKEQIQLLD